MSDALFEPVALGALRLSNRIVMAPMTRSRAGTWDAPTNDMVTYYQQRASAGLIITEGVYPAMAGKGYWRMPGIVTQEQIDGWGRVADAVRAEGGRIVMQLMHCGRVVVPANRSFDADIIAPSAVPCTDKVPGPDGVPTDCAMPRAMTAEDIELTLAEFSQAANNALAAGMSGVELHCASGYLIHQFLDPVANQRDDTYGGDANARALFPTEVLSALAERIGADRVGFRISPGNPYNAMTTDDPLSQFLPFVGSAAALGLAYMHIVNVGLDDLNAQLATFFGGPVIANNGLTGEQAAALIASDAATAVSFGHPFIANPDLPERFRTGAALAKPDYSRLYVGEASGYTDYPALAPQSPIAAEGSPS